MQINFKLNYGLQAVSVWTNVKFLDGSVFTTESVPNCFFGFPHNSALKYSAAVAQSSDAY